MVKTTIGGIRKMQKLIETLKSYDLPMQAIINIAESVAAWTKYEKLPQATKDSIQIIADIHNLIFIYNQIRGKLVLTGICKPMVRATYLYTAETLKYNSKLQGKKDYLLFPGADNQLVLGDRNE